MHRLWQRSQPSELSFEPLHPTVASESTPGPLSVLRAIEVSIGDVAII